MSMQVLAFDATQFDTRADGHSVEHVDENHAGMANDMRRRYHSADYDHDRYT